MPPGRPAGMAGLAGHSDNISPAHGVFLGYGFLFKLYFSDHLLILCCGEEGDPLSPPAGEASQGEHPLDPRFFGVFINLLRDYPNMGDARAAGTTEGSGEDFLQKSWTAESRRTLMRSSPASPHVP